MVLDAWDRLYFSFYFAVNSENINGLCITEVEGFVRQSVLGYPPALEGKVGIGM